MSRLIENRRYDTERALYHLTDAEIRNCAFAGPADGESVLAESQNIIIRDTSFSLPYPMPHVQDFHMENSAMDEQTCGALLCCERGEISGCTFGGNKSVRECRGITLRSCTVQSEDFGWKCEEISMNNSAVDSEYLFLGSQDITLEKVRIRGSGSFQYAENVTLTDCVLDSDDAFRRSKNVTLVNCEINGDRFGRFVDNLTLINCRIAGKQPLCYCTELKLRNCTMEGAEDAFEYSDVTADIRGHVDSVRNPKSGMIIADSVGEIIQGKPIMECDCYIQIRGEGWNWSC